MYLDYETKIAKTMCEQRTVSAALEVKSLSEDGRFAGYASVFDMTDSQQDRVLRGALRPEADGTTDHAAWVPIAGLDEWPTVSLIDFALPWIRQRG